MDATDRRYLLSPKANRNPEVYRDKHARLATSPEHRPLVDLADEIAAARGLPTGQGAVPYPDPDSGGVSSRALLLLSDPGPATRKSNLLSIDNNDETAATAWKLYREVGMDRTRALSWNVCPFPAARQNKPTAAELHDGAPWTRRLLELLPDLRVIVLMGRVAEQGWSRSGRAPAGVRVLMTRHPSAQGLNSGGQRELQRARMAEVLGEAAALVTG